MSNNKNNVSVGKPKVGGAIYRAPSGTTLPTDATTALDAAFGDPLGYISDDGVQNSISRTSQKIRAWGGDTVLSTQTEKTDTFKFTLIESLNPDVLKTVHGDSNVTGSLNSSGGLAVTVDGSDDTEHVYVVEQELNGNIKFRIVIPAAKVSEIGDITYKDDTAIGYPVTLTALPDSDENYHYEYRAGATGATGATGSTS